ncbi:flagellar biosynthesis protein FlgG [Helicobacter pylori]|nr:flagellar biosynthesis protein FlgG [Helicobacter pylori]
MEQLIEVIEANSGKFLHYETQQDETQQANKTKKMWYLAIISIVLIGLAVLAVFYMKGKHHSSDNPKSGVEKLKNPSHKNYKKNDNNRSKPLNP